MEKLIEKVQKDVLAAAISGPDGVVWYTTPGLVTDDEEIRTIVKAFTKESDAIYSGFKFQGKRFALTSLSQDNLIAETNTSILVVMKNEDFVVITFVDERKLRENCIEVCKNIYNEILENKLFLE